MDFKVMAQDFWRDGYLVVDDFFDQALMDKYQRLIVDHFGESPTFVHNEEFLQKSATDVIPWFPQQDGFAIESLRRAQRARSEGPSTRMCEPNPRAGLKSSRYSHHPLQDPCFRGDGSINFLAAEKPRPDQ